LPKYLSFFPKYPSSLGRLGFLFSLEKSRIVQEKPQSLASGFHNSSGNAVHASPEFQRRLATASEALCLEYLSEMKE